MSVDSMIIECVVVRKRRKAFWATELMYATDAYTAAVDALILAEQALGAYAKVADSSPLIEANVDRIIVKYEDAVELEEAAKAHLNEVSSCKETYYAYCDFIDATGIVGYTDSRTTDVIMAAPICNRLAYWIQRTSICYRHVPNLGTWL